MFQRSFEKKEAWMDNPEQQKRAEADLQQIRETSRPFGDVDIRHLPEQERKLIDKDNEIKSLQIKIAELYCENEELLELLKIASQPRRYTLPVKQVRGFMDFVDGQANIYATFDSNTNVLEHLSID